MIQEALIKPKFRVVVPRSGCGTEPRVAALRGYPGTGVIKDGNPNGVVSVSLLDICLAQLRGKNRHNPIGVGSVSLLDILSRSVAREKPSQPHWGWVVP